MTLDIDMQIPDNPNRSRGRWLNCREPSLTKVLDVWAQECAQTMRNASTYGRLQMLPAASTLSVVAHVHQPGTVVVSLSGEVDTITGPLITAAIAQQLLGAPERIIIELAGVTLLTSTGIRQLVEAQLDADAPKFNLVFVAPSDVALQALNMSGTVERFVIYSTIDDALRG